MLLYSNYIEPALLTAYEIIKGNFYSISDLFLIFLDNNQADDADALIPTLRLALARQRQHWFEGLWTHTGEPVSLKRV